LVRALAVETHENWMEANRYINMDDLQEHKKLALRQAVISPPGSILYQALLKSTLGIPKSRRI
ncbi:hypothetical protein GOC40_33230, partial [Sinorhizobium meliloti]|nr:hypothetical protein [Sinorhizobium meliloti]MDX0222679.1 hypothetical protein [Sinorhizobium meliloti]